MPFTRFHFGPAILIGLLLLDYIDFPTFVAANVIVDWRATLVFFGVIDGPLHSWPSTYPGALLSAVLLGSVMLYLRPALAGHLREAGIKQETSNLKIFAGAIAGVLLHVTLDAFHHPDIQPFLVDGFRPLLGLLSTYEVRAASVAALLLCFPVYFLHLWRDKAS
ncbi:MAG: hypothetical protein ABEJ07_06485 [Candidatus Nanohaloarchaea archaeon]